MNNVLKQMILWVHRIKLIFRIAGSKCIIIVLWREKFTNDYWRPTLFSHKQMTISSEMKNKQVTGLSAPM